MLVAGSVRVREWPLSCAGGALARRGGRRLVACLLPMLLDLLEVIEDAFAKRDHFWDSVISGPAQGCRWQVPAGCFSTRSGRLQVALIRDSRQPATRVKLP